MASATHININTLVCEARTLGFDDVLLDPTDDEIVHAVCEMLDTDWGYLSGADRERIVLAYDLAQAQLDPLKRKIWP